MTELPPLPLPQQEVLCQSAGLGTVLRIPARSYWTNNQMLDYGRQCYRAGAEAMRERAAKEVVNCTDFAHEERDIWMQETIASAVRALPLEEQTR